MRVGMHFSCFSLSLHTLFAQSFHRAARVRDWTFQILLGMHTAFQEHRSFIPRSMLEFFKVLWTSHSQFFPFKLIGLPPLATVGITDSYAIDYFDMHPRVRTVHTEQAQSEVR